MSLAAGREFLSIPGPTVIPDAVLAAMQRPAVDIYSGPLVALTDGLLADISKIFQTKGRSYIYAANGHGAWEAALTNVLSRGDKVLVLESGRFAIGWGEAAGVLGCDVEILAGDFRRAVNPEAVEARLKADRKGEIKAILVAQIGPNSPQHTGHTLRRLAGRSGGHGCRGPINSGADVPEIACSHCAEIAAAYAFQFKTDQSTRLIGVGQTCPL